MNIFKRRNNSGFTIVELLIVIVVIAILAAISIVAYNGIQERARVSSVSSALSQASRKVTLYQAEHGSYPSSLADVSVSNNSNISYTYSVTPDGYCMTALLDGKMPYNSRNNTITAGPCDGQSGGAGYCPQNSHVAINGYYCDGSDGSTATLNSNAVKLSASSAGVPAGAPAAYVGRQNARDNYYSSSFSVTAGETYCVEGWVATENSTLQHQIGLQLTNSSGSNVWYSGTSGHSTAISAPTSAWRKITGCITVPSGYISARGWSQNNGYNPEAQAYWYQTAMRLWKQ